VDNGFAFFEAQLAQHCIDAFRSEDAHQVVFKRQVELGSAGIALASGAAA